MKLYNIKLVSLVIEYGQYDKPMIVISANSNNRNEIVFIYFSIFFEMNQYNK